MWRFFVIILFMTLSLFFNLFTTFGAIILVLLTASIYIAAYSKNPKAIAFNNFFARNATVLILISTFLAVAGSLVYSEIFKFAPCVLCWWQRIFIYPVFIIALVAFLKKDKTSLYQYINPMMWIALLFSLYHNYLIVAVQKYDSVFCIPNTTETCSSRFVDIVSVIDIPFMALAIILFVLCLSFIATKNKQG